MADTAYAQQLNGLDTARLCREELVIPPMRRAQWRPLLTQWKKKMLCAAKKAGADQAFYACGATNRTSSPWPKTKNRHRLTPWFLFLNAVESPDKGANWTDPAFGISFTPRTLRRGLADAWRKWNAIIALQGNKLTIHPESLLVACLVRACRPDIWNVLIRSEGLLNGEDWPQQTFSLIRPNGFSVTHKLPDPTDIPHLGLHVDIRNMMTKEFNHNPSLAVQGGAAGGAGKASISPTLFQRPGGLIGKLESDTDPGRNWRIFLNA